MSAIVTLSTFAVSIIAISFMGVLLNQNSGALLSAFTSNVLILSENATNKFEATRDKVSKFINSPDRKQVIFTKGTTEAVNLVAQSYVKNFQYLLLMICAVE